MIHCIRPILKEQDKVVLMEEVVDMYQNKKSSMKKKINQFSPQLVVYYPFSHHSSQTMPNTGSDPIACLPLLQNFNSIFMDPYLYSCCGNDIVVLKASNSDDHNGRLYYCCPLAKGKNFGCEYFVWEDELCLCKCGQGLCHAFKNQKGVTHICPQIGEKNCGFRQFIGTAVLKARSSPVPARSSPVPKIAEASCSSPGSSRGLEANCSNCKHLMLKISLLQAKLDLARGLDCRLDELLADFDGLLLA
ncbi:hypothetical protein CTI12_AA061640 [Artemisia annua]|uniref:GRF-type domain-containing protein n=1 Tax=Artemisia annua TaxID=35608 RepID=A0A2U1Q8P7_ARTAN|nr:hypothetical protein CTI12_AA061640 [Artemisia annua]